jgi:hypothetical protein
MGPMGGMPQGGMDPMAMGGEDPMAMGNGMPQGNDMDPMAMGGEDASQDNNFGGGFDPGVEANEETDPTKFIQQLAGKLSQSLKKYNDENPDDESGLNKYVAGMVATQAAKGLTEPERNEIIKKINTGEVDDESDEEMPDDEMGENGEEDTPNEDMPMESKSFRFSKKQLVENFITTQGQRDETEVRKNTNLSSKVKNKKETYKAFLAPEFNK